MNDTLKDYHAGQIADEAARRLKDPALEWHRKQKEKDDRIEQLEQLCRDLYREGCYYWLLTNNDPPTARSAWCDDFCSRMDELGLLEGESE